MTLLTDTQTNTTDGTDLVAEAPLPFDQEMDIVHFAKHRQTTKAYESSRKFLAEKIEKIKELLRYTAPRVPTSNLGISSSLRPKRASSGSRNRRIASIPSIARTPLAHRTSWF